MAKFADVDDYLARLPPEQQEVLEEIERRVLALAHGAERVIRYDMPTWQVDGTSLVHAAAWKKHVSLYPVPATRNPLSPACRADDTKPTSLTQSNTLRYR